ncbi:MAG: hypothetical protein ABR502_05105 [Chitinophagaceae bacterium]
MDFEYKHLLPADFTDNSRVWVYQSSRLFTLPEVFEIEELIEQFIVEWQAHGATVKANGNLFFGQFLNLMADERNTQVSGCSTDSSVRFIKALGDKLQVDFFNRNTLAFVIKDKIELLPLHQLQYAFDNNLINTETLYFNNLVQTKVQLENNWIVPVKDSWLAQKLQLQPHY